jgi:signal transduction histidine kinase
VTSAVPESSLPTPPYETLRARLEELARTLDAAGAGQHAAALRAALDPAWRAHLEWSERVGRALAAHHEINNALVGVRGNAQLLMMGPAGREPGVKERLEVVIRESQRIQEAAGRLREVRAALSGSDPAARAA